MGWRFKTCDQDARLVCAHCARVVRSLRSPSIPADSRFLEAVRALSAGLSDAIDNEPSVADEVMRVARLLWATPHGRGLTPLIARVLTERPLPSVEAQVDRSEPLATIPLGWRMAMLIAVAQLLDLANARRDFGMPSFSLERLMDWTGDSPPRRPMDRTRPVAPEPSRGRRPQRDMADYRAMADAILASKEWRQVQGQSAATRQRMLGRLMIRALDRAPPVQAGAPDPAATSRRRRPIAGRRAASAPASFPIAPRSRAGVSSGSAMAMPATRVISRSSGGRRGDRLIKSAAAILSRTSRWTARRSFSIVQHWPLWFSTRTTSSQLCCGRIRCTVGSQVGAEAIRSPI